MVKSGLVAVATLDGGPVDRDDAVALGLHGSNQAHHLDGAILRATDHVVETAEGFARVGSRTLTFLGETRETDALAAAIGRPGADPATLAMDVIDHWDSGRGAQLQGDWSLMQWDEARRELIVAASPGRRDNVFVAQAGSRVAISPSISALADLPWVGREIDHAGLASTIARREVRIVNAQATMLGAVTRLPPGEMLRIDAAGRQRVARVEEPEPARWEGDFHEAVAALEGELRSVIRAMMAPHRIVAVQLSGGLDSSLIACLVAEELRADQELFFVCSVAPAGSGIPDERDVAAIVAARAGAPIHFIEPDPAADMFLPDWEMSEVCGGPCLNGAHHVSTALQEAARARGATLLFDGVSGEDHISRPTRFVSLRTRTRDMIELGRRQLTRWQRGSLQDNFHPRLAAGFLAGLPAELRRIPPPTKGFWATPRNATIGDPILRSQPYVPTAIPYGAIRLAMPFRARSLQRLAYGMPAAFTERDGMGRAIAREMLRGRVPDEIRLRRGGRPFAPDHHSRLQRQAAALPERIDGFAADGVGAIVDLDWLRASAARVAQHGPRSWDEAFELQLTGMLAAFLSGWQRRA